MIRRRLSETINVQNDGRGQYVRMGKKPKTKVVKPSLKKVKGGKKVWETKTKPPHGIIVSRHKSTDSRERRGKE